MEKDAVLTRKELNKIKNVRNREGEIIPFDLNKIIDAVQKAFIITNEGGEKEAQDVAKKVFHKLAHLKASHKDKKFVPGVEMLQDMAAAHNVEGLVRLWDGPNVTPHIWAYLWVLIIAADDRLRAEPRRAYPGSNVGHQHGLVSRRVRGFQIPLRHSPL